MFVNDLHFLSNVRTITYLSVVYAIGSAVIAIGAIPTLGLPASVMTVIGLLLIAVGTGGIKPCVSAFGGDQFKLPQQARQLETFFSLFYFAINAGSLISTSLTPVLREDVHCFGNNDCYSLAFGVPGALMIVSIGKTREFFKTKTESVKIFLYSYLHLWQSFVYSEETRRKHDCLGFQVHWSKFFLF